MSGVAMVSLPWQPPCTLVSRAGDRYIKNRIWVHYFSPILTDTEFCRQIFVELPSMYCLENQPSRSRGVTYGL
jgi:hypothetical protein